MKLEDQISCYNCDTKLDLTRDSKIFRQDNCDHCNSSLHCCKMCKFYDEHSYNECKEPVAQRILDKEKANFCDFFAIKNCDNEGDIKKSHLDAANALFKD